MACGAGFLDHCCRVSMLRLPSPTATTAKVDLSSFENKNGYSWQAVQDLQRVFACLSMADGKDVDEDYGMLVSTAEFSPKVTVPMSAQSLWRTVHFFFCHSWFMTT